MTWRCLDGDCSSGSAHLIDNVHGHIYSGQIKDGLPFGEGVLVYGPGGPGTMGSGNDGDVYTGNWSNFKGRYYKHGPGQYTDVRLQMTKSGTFYFDKLVLSPGRIEMPGGATQEGFWVNDMLLVGDCAKNVERAVAEGLTPAQVKGLTVSAKNPPLAGTLEGVCEVRGPSGRAQVEFRNGEPLPPDRRRSGR